MAETSASAGKKRARDDEDEEILSLEKNLTFSDTLVALQMMRAQFPNIEKVFIQPFILQSQLYSSVKDRTQVDRDLEVDNAVKRLGTKNQQDFQVFEWFKRHVIESKLDVSIDNQELLSLLSFGGKVQDTDVTLLISAGLLGRKELVSFLNRRKYKEMPLAVLEKKRLRLSPLDMRFHLRDLIGSGQLKTVHTPTGLLVRVSKD